MKSSAFAVFASLFAAAAAQRIVIFSPTSGQTLTAGENVTVEVVRPNSLTNVEEIGIGIAVCHYDCNSSCGVNGTLGTSLFTGSYNPQFDPATENMPNENFTVTIPANIGAGPMLLSVAHASFIGASTEFFTEVVNVTVNIA